ncbi:MAG TPA: hypothetical protein VGX78_13380 [Pirellulales bacterium]|nr:hypothetical protein [Pirellulales bacterium]
MKFADGSRWLASDREEFRRSAGARTPTIVFVPGNNYSSAATNEVGLANYRDLVRQAPAEGAVRFVTWSWPSEPAQRGPLKDVRTKAGRADVAAYHLAVWLNEYDGEGSLSLVAASLGARVVGGALHLAGGGQLAGYELSPRDTAQTPLASVVFVSAAVDDDWLLAGHRYGRAMTRVERVLLINNHTDRLLKQYHRIHGPRSNAAALGYSGLPCGGWLGTDSAKIEQVDVARFIGHKHGCRLYFQSPEVVALMLPYLFTDASRRIVNEREAAAGVVSGEHGNAGGAAKQTPSRP